MTKSFETSDSGTHQAPGSSGGAMPIREALLLLRRQCVPLALCTLVGLGVGAVNMTRVRPLFTATTDLLYDARKVRAIQGSYAYSNESWSGLDAQLESQSGVIQSTLVTEQVLARIAPHLEAPEIQVAIAEQSGLPSIGTLLAKVATQFGFPTARANAPTHLLSLDERLEYLRKGVKVSRVGRSQVVSIAYSSPDPVLSAEVANSFAEAFLEAKSRSQQEETARATDWLRSQLSEAKVAWERAETAIETYKRRHRLVAVGGVLIDEKKLVDAMPELLAVRSDIVRLETRNRRIAEAIGANQIDAALVETLGSIAVDRARAKYLASEQTMRDLVVRQNLPETHILVVRLREELREQKQQVLTELQRLSDSLRNELKIAKDRESILAKNYESLMHTNNANGAALLPIRELEGRSEFLKVSYTTLLQRYHDALQQKSLQNDDFRVLERAKVPRDPDRVGRLKAVVPGLLLGLVFGFGWGAVREFLDGSFRTARQAQTELGLEPVHFLPLLPAEQADAVADGTQPPSEPAFLDHIETTQQSGFSKQLLMIKTHLDARTRQASNRLIGVVSAIPGEGTSTVASNLASLLANLGERVLLIDANGENPSCSRHFAADRTTGLEAAIAAGRLTGDLVATVPGTGLDVLAIGRGQNPAKLGGLLARCGARGVLNDARQAYAYVIIDLPALSTGPDAEAVVSSVDGFVFVTTWGRSPVGMVRDTLTQRSMVQAKCLSVALNMTNCSQLSRYQGVRHLRTQLAT